MLFKEVAATTHKKEQLAQWHALHHQTNKWHKVQFIYMPEVAYLLEVEASDISSTSHICPEDELLYLPPSISSDICLSCCIQGLPTLEHCICLEKADDALNELCQQLCITSSIIQFKQGQHQVRSSVTNQRLWWPSLNKTQCTAIDILLCILHDVLWILEVAGWVGWSCLTYQGIFTYHDRKMTMGWEGGTA